MRTLYYETLHNGLIKVEWICESGLSNGLHVVKIIDDSMGYKNGDYLVAYKRDLVHRTGTTGYHIMITQADLPK